MRLRTRLCSSAALALTLASGAFGAHAQTDATVAEVIVTGQRAADKSAIAVKRRESRIVDVISADDVGKLADFNAGEALRRVAGVNVWTYLGEPRFVTIRGFNTSYNTTTVDGFMMASPDNANYGGGRQFYMDALPSNITNRITVLKTSTADMEGHSVGGSVDFSVPDALDAKRDRSSVTARWGVADNKKRFGGDRGTAQAEFLLTRRLGDRDQFGLSLSGSYWRREMNIAQYENGGDAYSFGPSTKSGGYAVVLNPYDGTYKSVPSALTAHNYDDTRERAAVYGKLSWRIDKDTKLALGGYVLDQKEKFLRNEFNLDPAQGGSNYDARNFADGYLEMDDVANLHQYLQARFKRRIKGLNLSLDHHFSEKLTGEFKLGSSRATFDNPQLFNRFALPAANNEYYSLKRFGDYYVWTPIGATFPAKVANYANYSTSNGGGQSGASGGRNLEERFGTKALLSEVEGRLDYGFAQGDDGLGVSGGFKFSRNNRHDDYVRTDYGAATSGTLLSDVATGDNLSAPGCDSCIPLVDIAKLNAMTHALPATVNPGAVGNRFGTTEKITAAFLMGRWRAAKWEVQGGLRVERTDYDTWGYNNVSGGGGATGYVRAEAHDAHTNWLPSASFIYNTSSQSRARFAYSRTLGRPSLTQKSLRGGVIDYTAATPTRTSGNPDLEARVSDNFDAIQEFYFDKGQGLLTVGLFHKIVRNEIYKVQTLATLDGVDYFWNRPANSPYKTQVTGLEFNIVKHFDEFPGALSNLGAQANGVIIKTKFPVGLSDGGRYVFKTLPDQAKNAYNLAVFYEDKQGFRARLAWNHTGRAWDGRISGATNLPGADNISATGLYKISYNSPRDYLDFSISQKFKDKYTISFSGSNLTHQGADTDIGSSQEIAAKRLYVPSVYMIGVSASF